LILNGTPDEFWGFSLGEPLNFPQPFALRNRNECPDLDTELTEQLPKFRQIRFDISEFPGASFLLEP